MKTVQLDDAVWQALKLRAVQDGLTLRQVIADAVTRYLHRPLSEAPIEAQASPIESQER